MRDRETWVSERLPALRRWRWLETDKRILFYREVILRVPEPIQGRTAYSRALAAFDASET